MSTQRCTILTCSLFSFWFVGFYVAGEDLTLWVREPLDLHENRIVGRRQLDDDAQFTFLGAEPYHSEYDYTKSTKLGESDSDSILRSMPDDYLVSLISFETSETADNDSQEELHILKTRVDQLESRISKKVTDDVQSSVPSIVVDALTTNLLGLLSEALKNTLPKLIKDSIKQSVLKSIEDKLPLFDAHVQQTL
ncbi:hypothetical protein Tco_1204926 [Tanacetum coccineum]